MKNVIFKQTVLSAALLAVFTPVLAEDSDADVKELSKPDSSVSVGIGNWSADRPHQGIYDGMRNSGAYGLIDADIIKRDDATGTWLKLKATNLGLDTREIRGDYIRQGQYGAFLEYSRTPRDNPYTITTGTQGIGTTNLTVGVTPNTFARREVELGTERDLYRLGGFTMIAPGLELKLDFKNEDKTGTRQTGWGSAALFSVEPVNSTIRQFDAILQYTENKLQLSGGYSGSWYDNKNPLILERLNGVTGGTSAQFNSLTPLSQPMSNQAHQLFVDGGYAFTPTTRGTFKLAYTVATQDEHLPTFDLGGANAPFINAPSNLDGQVNTTLVQLGLNSRPIPKLSITGNLRYYDVNDKTPLRGFVGSNATGVATVFNTPQSFTTTSGKLEATYRLPQNLALTGGVEYSAQDRSFPQVGQQFVPFRADVNETTYKLQLRRALADNVNGAVAYLHSDRSGSTKYATANYSVPLNNQINPLHIADRTRDKVRATFDWEPLEQLSLNFRAEYSQDDYQRDGRPYGLQNGEAQLYSIDASYAFSDNWSLSTWYSYDLTKARDLSFRAGSAAAPALADAVKDTHLKDVGDSFGAKLRGRLTAKIEAGFGIDWFRSTSSTPQDLTLTSAGSVLPAGTTGNQPEIKNDLLRLRLDGKYVIDKASEVRFDLIHERWHSDDWTWNLASGAPYPYFSGNISCTGCSNTNPFVVDGTTVTAKQTQTSNFVGVRYVYKFQ